MGIIGPRRRSSELRSWHRELHAAIDGRELDVKDAVARGAPVPDSVLGMTEAELSQFFERHRVELDVAASLLVLAEAEAVLRTDFLARVERRGKDVSRAFREIDKQYGKKVRLDEDLLGTWTDIVPAAGAAISAFRGALKLRHWLAHGRYWVPKLGQDYSAEDAFRIAEALFAKLPGVVGWG